MRTLRSVAQTLITLAAWSAASIALAQGPASAPAASAPVLASTAASAPAAAGQGTEYTEKGADTCIACHGDASPGYLPKAIFRSRHAQRHDSRTPFGPGGLQCEACHGPGARHAASGDKTKIITFEPDSSLTVEQRDQPCLGCHQGGARNAGHSGAHERAQVACADCHKMHAGPDPVLAKATESEVCFSCHKQQQADFQKTSSHPLRFGRMACSDCHNSHGSTSPSMLVEATVNQTCYTCHTEKRGPFLWEHAPVAENCALCHVAHGSVRDDLLTKSPPLLCQQCHSVAGHPAVARTGAALPGRSPGGPTGASIFLIAGSCTNCHSQVHGSNHPSGSMLMR